MKFICFSAAWLIPSLMFVVSEAQNSRIINHWQSMGLKEKNAIGRARLQKSRRFAAPAYALVLLVLLSASSSHMRGSDDAILATGIWVALAWFSYNVVRRVSFWLMDGFALNGSKSLAYRDEGFIAPISDRQPQGDHGRSILQSAEQLGMAGRGSMEPEGKVGQQ